ncbi:hypothetical protein FQA39_LY16459 [Lamprigera yunnana]|nr:hypothetical protein FQA39_LY16459 [Lamprigera yunnana]
MQCKYGIFEATMRVSHSRVHNALVFGKSHLPIILTGDFNLSPESAVYELLTTGFLKYDHLTYKSLSRRNTTYATGKQLLPSFLRITDNCQHADLLEHRINNDSLNRNDELQLIQLNHSERAGVTKQTKGSVTTSLFSTGTLSHEFALKSAYVHTQGNDIEATTYQDRWITVDYIFYSAEVNERTGRKSENKLKLLSRYSLPTAQQLGDIKIPNYVFGSDHLLLLVTFILDS